MKKGIIDETIWRKLLNKMYEKNELDFINNMI